MTTPDRPANDEAARAAMAQHMAEHMAVKAAVADRRQGRPASRRQHSRYNVLIIVALILVAVGSVVALVIRG